MRCQQHSDSDAIAICINCKNGLCDECRVRIAGKNYCQKCADELYGKSIEDIKSDKQKGNVLNSIVSDFNHFVKKNKIDKEILKVQDNLDDFLEDVGKDLDKFIQDSKDSLSENRYKEIKNAKKLLDIGAITEEEFSKIKKDILDKNK